mmetsp:Transcript_3925/g.14868  ORF Transcript_3925/g.14868 Transcript_3925/m.14868 type:complete len:88 (+) Transcript_3925:2706-2969(+)
MLELVCGGVWSACYVDGVFVDGHILQERVAELAVVLNESGEALVQPVDDLFASDNDQEWRVERAHGVVNHVESFDRLPVHKVLSEGV